jgi:nucleoside-diphosphate-sugar epimerase
MLLGAHGFIGSELARQLNAQSIPTLTVSSQQLDLTASQAAPALASLLRPTDAVVMLAALTPDKGRDTATLLRNITMMQSVCTAMSQTGCAHFVYFSSDAVYDSAISRVSEDTPAAPQDLYGVMHLARECMARNFGGGPVLVLRPTLVYGCQDSHNAYGPNRFSRAAKDSGRITLFGGGEETRDHIAVEDVAALTVRCLLTQRSGILNVATGVSTTFSGVANLVATNSARTVEVVGTSRANPITHRHYDITRLIKAFPDFRCVPLPDGIARMQHYLNQDAHG